MPPTLLRITPRDANAEDPEDLFATALGTIFTDDLRNQHGDPGALITYLSRRLDAGLDLSVADPAGEEERKKFAHYLWNAGVLMAELCGAGRAGVLGVEARMGGIGCWMGWSGGWRGVGSGGWMRRRKGGGRSRGRGSWSLGQVGEKKS